MNTRWTFAIALCALSATAGCGSDPAPSDQDSGFPVDTGTDSGTVTDRGFPVDTGRDSGTDAGQPTDNGAPVDAGTDGGQPTDNGGTDAGKEVDAGGSIDAGFDAGTPTDVPLVGDTGVDAGTPDAGPVAVCPAVTGTITLPSTATGADGGLPVFMGTTAVATDGGAGDPSNFAGTRCQSNAAGPDRAYSLVVTARTGVILSTDNAGTNFDTILSIRRTCTDAATELSCDDDTGVGTDRGTTSVLRAVLDPGTYTVIVDGYSTGTSSHGTYALTATTFTPVANATCATAQALTVGTAVTAQSLTDAGGPSYCAPGGRPGGQRFYSVTIPANTVATAVVTRATGSWSPVLRASADCAATTCTDSATGSATTRLSIPNTGATAITRILSVAADSAESTTTPFDLVVNTAPYVAGQICAMPVVVAPGASATGQNAANGSVPSNACNTSSANGGQLFYSVTVPAGTRVVARAVPAGATTSWTPTLRLLETCTSSSCDDSSTAATAGGTASLTLSNNGTAAATYLLSVSGSATSTGTFTFEVGAGTALPGYTSAPITVACDDVSSGTVPSTRSGGGYSDDSTSAIAALPFTFNLFGEAQTRFSVNSNGVFQLYPAGTGGTAFTAYSNTSIPDTDDPNGYVAAFWDDLLPTGSEVIHAATLGTAPARRYVVEWTNFPVGDPDVGAHVTTQVALFETGGVVELRYCNVTAGDTRASGDEATVGIESASGEFGTQVSYNTAGAAVTGHGYRLTPR